MANVTIALEDSLIAEGRKLAEQRSTTLNGMLRGFLERSLKQDGSAWLDSLFAEVDASRAKARRPRSGAKRAWSRDELYDV
jgi:hypothetical protein